MSSTETFGDLSEHAKNVVQACHWQAYQTPENVVLFLVGECAELGEYCQWLPLEQLKVGGKWHNQVAEEIADVIASVLCLSNVLPIEGPLDFDWLLQDKVSRDVAMYPPGKYIGKSKYDVEPLTRDKGDDSPIPRHPESHEQRTVAECQEQVWKFVTERKWEAFNTPASLALAVNVKSGLIATCYQRRPRPKDNLHERMVWAMVDILLTALRLCKVLRVDNTSDIVLKKLDGWQRRFASQS